MKKVEFNSRELEGIIAIAEEKQITKAAEKLHLTQPSMSRLLKDVEARLGIKLFDRDNTRSNPTEAGFLYIDKALKILELEQTFLLEIEKLKEETNHRTLFVMYFEESYWLYDILSNIEKRIATQFDNFKVDVVVKAPVEIEKSFIESRADFAIIVTPPKSANIKFIPLKTYEILVAIPSNHPVLKTYKYTNNTGLPVIDLNLFKNSSFVFLDEEYLFRNICISFCKNAGFTPKIAYNIQNIEAGLVIIEKNNQEALATFVFDEMIDSKRNNYENIVFFKIKNIDKSTLQEISIAYKKTRKLNNLDKLFITSFQEEIKKLDAERENKKYH